MNTRLTRLHGSRPQLSQLRTLHSQPQITHPASTTCHDRLIRRRPNLHAQNNPGQRTSGEKKRLFTQVSRLFPSGLETYGRLHRVWIPPFVYSLWITTPPRVVPSFYVPEGPTMIEIPNEETPLAGPVNNVILNPRNNVTPTPLNNISAKLSNSKTGKKYELVPPDGGWGWAIVASGSIIYSLVVPVPPLHSLFYKDIKKEVNLSATEISIITNVPGGLFFIYVSSLPRYLHFVHPWETAPGLTMIFHSSNVAITTFFKKNRAKAMGFVNTLGGISGIWIPLLIGQAMAMYGTRGAILIMAGLLLHGLVAAMLLQPVAWHMKREEVVDTGGQQKDEEQGNNILASTKLLAKNGELQENQSLEGSKETNENVSRDDSKETQISLLNSSGFHRNNFDKNRVFLNGNTTLKPQSTKRGNDRGKLSSLAVGLDLGLLKDKTFLMLLTGIWLALAAETIFVFFTPFILDDLGFTTEEITNILAVISGGDLLFRFLAPFIADWIKFDDKLMFVLSLVLAVLTRILAYVYDINYLHIYCPRCPPPPPCTSKEAVTRRTMACSRCMLASSFLRALVASVNACINCAHVSGLPIMLVTSFEAMLSVGLALGASKGIMMVYRALVIPNYVPMERVSSALALQMVGVGFTVLISSPFAGYVRLGLALFGTLSSWHSGQPPGSHSPLAASLNKRVLRDLSGSYNTSVTVVNVVTVLAILIYVVEINLSRRHNRRKPSR
uniref:Uncharacterized protein n=1 Tax=Timema shepardi TaxID=629360 RepID=A0A7R9FV58_TIMSH|nr:unnamed protein product [Timema shepardi]